MKQRVHLYITGDVIGVGFRSWTSQQARNLKLVGWVRNLENRKVEVIAEGPREKLIEFLSLCNEGPEVSWVEKVDASWKDATGEFGEFMIR
jgi:acylphosphatase